MHNLRVYRHEIIHISSSTNILSHTMAMNIDRRRNNAPSGGTSAPVFARTIREPQYVEKLRPTRSRGLNELRRICELLVYLSALLRAACSLDLDVIAYNELSTSFARLQDALVSAFYLLILKYSPPNVHHTLCVRLRLP